MKDYIEQQGAGEKDLVPAGSPTIHRDVGDNTAKPDAGALAAFGGIASAIKIQRAKVSAAPSIDKPGYPMAGEAPGGATGVHGAMDGGKFKEEDPYDCG